jgi:hypothetical protein
LKGRTSLPDARIFSYLNTGKLGGTNVVPAREVASRGPGEKSLFANALPEYDLR